MKAVKEARLPGGTGVRLPREYLREAQGKPCLESSTIERLEAKPQANIEESVRGALHHAVFCDLSNQKVFGISQIGCGIFHRIMHSLHLKAFYVCKKQDEYNFK